MGFFSTGKRNFKLYLSILILESLLYVGGCIPVTLFRTCCHSERSSALRQIYFCLVKKKNFKKSMQYLRNDLVFHTNEYANELSPFDQNFCQADLMYFAV